MVYLFLADGFETIEALTVVDMLRRASIDIQTVSVSGSTEVTSAQKITVKADILFDDISPDPEAVILPGGMPGTLNLKNHRGLVNLIRKQYSEGRLVAAICAAPSILSEMGILKGRKAISYPTFEEQLSKEGALITREKAVTSDNVITSRGMGTAISFGAAIISWLKDEKTADSILKSIVYQDQETSWTK